MKNNTMSIKKLIFALFFILISSWSCNAINYYSKATGDLNVLSTWGTATDGTGAAPANFTTAGNVFFIQNNANPTITANWTVSGAGSKVVVGNGTNPCNFNVGGALVFTATTDVLANATLTLTTSGVLTGIVFGTVASTSFVIYSGGDKAIRDYNYGNLGITGSGIKTWTLAGARTIAGNLIVNPGVVLTTAGNQTLGVAGTTSIRGTLNLGGTSAKTFTGDVTLDSNAIWNETAIAGINFAGNFNNNAKTFTANTGFHIFSGTTKTISGSTAMVIPSVAINGTRTIAVGTTVTVNTALSGAGALTNLGILNSGGTVSTTTLANGGTMTKSGTGTMTTALANLTNTGTLNLTGSGAITGITNNAEGIVNLVDSGTITSFNNATSTSTLNISDLSVPTITTLTATAAGNTVNYNGDGAQAVKDATYGILILSGSGMKTWTLAGARTIAGNLTVNRGAALTTAGNQTIGVTGTTSISGTLNLGGTSAKTFTGDVRLNTGCFWNETAISAINFAGNFTNNATTFTSSTGLHTFSGPAKTISGSTATVIPSVNITGTRSIAVGTTVTVNTALSGAGALTNLGILNSGGSVSTTTLANGGTMTKSGTGTMTTALANLTNTGTLNLTGSGAITGITNNAGGIVNLVDSGTITSFNNATATSTLNISDLTVPTITTLTATVAGNTVNYNGLGAQAVKSTTYANLNLSGGSTKTFNAITTVANLLAIASGTNVNLTAAVTHSCVGLSLGGVAQPTGAYGGTGSTGTTINSTYFTATSGKINNNCTAVVITTQPATPAPTCNANGIQTMTVTATGTGLMYSWRKASIAVTNGGVFSGQGTPTLTLTNPTSADIGSYDVVVSGSCASSVTSTAVTVAVTTSTSWTGIAGTTWTNPANWSSCGVPNSNSNVVISLGPNQPVIASNVTINSLTIDSAMNLTVNSGNNLTVTNAIANAGALTIKSNANLIQTSNVVNTGSGVTNVERQSSLLFRLDYTLWSSPVSGPQTLGGFSPLTSANRFYIYDTNTNLYNAVSSGTAFGLAKGYLIRMPNTWVDFVPPPGPPATPASWTGVFTGTPNNGDITISGLTSGQFYAVGNPYPSTINADLFLNGSSTDGTLYFWRKTNGAAGTSYATYTLAGGVGTAAGTSGGIPNGTIQVGQGFVVKATSTTLSFTNVMRVANTTNQFFKTKQVEKNRIWLNLSKDTKPVSQMLLAYMTGATQEIDKGIDGRYFNDSQMALNSFLNNEEFSIQGRALPFDGTDIVPLAFKTTADGNYTIAIDQVDGLFSGNQDIYLLDSKTGAETNLKTATYSFTAATGVDNTRFSLKFQKTLSLDAPAFSDNSIIVYKNNGVIYVNSGAKMMSNIKVFDIQGRLIAEHKNVKANTTAFQNLKSSNQLLIVKVTTEDNLEISTKVEN